ncbi:MAG TPA: MsnO8 family LLM class oxidoreductase [Chloroflexia bacterium]|nr:MsnO8 family LLM class oxidoreductase [Chloroflexia bacterium]
MNYFNTGPGTGFTQPLQLGILDLCKRAPGEKAGTVLHNTLALAEQAEKWGYVRYWVGEHHTPDSAQASPEIMIGLIAARTSSLKVGSGGVLLRYYSPLKVAESFLLLEALYPGRVELGVCKGPGVTSPQQALALASGNIIELTEEAYERKIQDLARYYREANDGSQVGTSNVPQAYPLEIIPPPLWVLGGSGKAMRLAAVCGSPYAHTIFTSPAANRAEEDLSEYYGQFTRQNPLSNPRSILALSIVCLESQERAEQRHREMLEKGCLPSNIVGSPDYCAEQLVALAHKYQTSELLITTWLGNWQERLTVYGLLAEACHAVPEPVLN